jgi:hypothetical protein
VRRIPGCHARELRCATRPGELVWRWHVLCGPDKRVFDVRPDNQSKVLDARLADDERMTMSGG